MVCVCIRRALFEEIGSCDHGGRQVQILQREEWMLHLSLKTSGGGFPLPQGLLSFLLRPPSDWLRPLPMYGGGSALV